MINTTKRIGITGGIGSGKSEVTKILRANGYTVIDADEVSREASALGEPALDKLRDIFGDVVFLDDGNLNRATLAEIIFSDEGKRRTVEGIFHAEIGKRINILFNEAITRGEKKIFICMPLMFETGNAEGMDEVWVISTDEDTRVNRVMKRDGLSEPEVYLRLSAQLDEEERLSKGGIIIENNGTLKELKMKVDDLLKYDIC